MSRGVKESFTYDNVWSVISERRHSCNFKSSLFISLEPREYSIIYKFSLNRKISPLCSWICSTLATVRHEAALFLSLKFPNFCPCAASGASGTRLYVGERLLVSSVILQDGLVRLGIDIFPYVDMPQTVAILILFLTLALIYCLQKLFAYRSSIHSVQYVKYKWNHTVTHKKLTPVL